MKFTVGDRLRRSATTIVSIVVTGVWMGALAAEHDWWLPALVVGYVVVVPVIGILSRDSSSEGVVATGSARPDPSYPSGNADTDAADPESSLDEALAALRERYARGEITDDQFERKLQRLVTIQSAEDLDNRSHEPERNLFDRERGH